MNSLRCCLSLLIITTLWYPLLGAAQPHDPVEELFRFGVNDHLIIDRGGPVDAAGDINGDGIADILVGSGAGAVRVIFGPTNGNNGTLNAQQIDGISGFNILHDLDNLTVLAGLGDLNDDGFDDVAVSTITGTYVVFGKNSGFERSVDPADFNGVNGFIFDSPTTSVSSAGDINNDGIVDMLVGNANASANGLTGVGVTYVIYGKRGRFPALMDISSLDGTTGFAVLGTNSEDRSGKFVGDAGDFNNDGVDDFLIGAPNKTQAGVAEVGEAYMVYGRSAGFPAAISLSDINGSNGFVFKGSNIQDSAGSAVTGIGDLNHDGIDDIAISAPGKGPFGSPSDYPGETYVLFGGKFEGAVTLNEDSLNGINGFVARGIRGGVVPIEEDQAIWGDLSGTSVDGAGDYNDDGIDDLLIGASHTIINPRRKGVGQIYVVYGTTSGFPARLNLIDLDGANGFRINGIGTVDYFGVYSRKAGDFNADGKDDIIIGASGESTSYVIYGRDPWGPQLAAPPPVENTGSVSSGFESIAFVRLPDEPPLIFDELADPTGPNPLPPGTSTELGNPATPGDIRPNLFDPVQPLRPEDVVPAQTEQMPVIEEETPVTVTPADSSTQLETGAETESPATQQNEQTNTSNNQNVVTGNSDTIRVGVGAVWILMFPILCMLLQRLYTLARFIHKGEARFDQVLLASGETHE